MKLSVFTTATMPIKRGDIFIEALKCYNDLADEVIVVDGTYLPPGVTNKNHPFGDKIKVICREWPQEFTWPFIGEQFQRGYEAATGDWVIHADLDFIFHEQDFSAICQAFEDNPTAPALTFWKYQFILPDRYNLKSRLVLAVNRKAYGDRIKFNGGGDLCQPTLDGKLLTPDDVPEARVPFYNYEKLTKTKEQILDDQGRMERAYFRHFGHYQLAHNDSNGSAYQGWLEMQLGRFKKPQESIPLSKHPQFIQDTIKNLRPEQWGYNGFGILKKGKVYDENIVHSR